MSKPCNLPPAYEVDELDYEQKVNYKLKIFEILFPENYNLSCADIIIDKTLKVVNQVYEGLTK